MEQGEQGEGEQSVNKRIQHILEAADAALQEAGWGGGFETSREAQDRIQAGLKADAKKRKAMILVQHKQLQMHIFRNEN